MPKISFWASMSDGFKNELLKSEETRARVIMVITFLAFIQIMVNYVFFPGWVETMFKNRTTFHVLIAWSLVFTLFEFMVQFNIRRFRKLRRRIPWIAPYGNMTMEVSLVSFILAAYIYLEHSAYLLDSSIYSAYFILLILSVMHLDQKVATYGGLLAGAQYLALAWYAMSNEHITFTDEYHASGLYHWMRGFVLMIGGVAAGFVGRQLQRRVSSALDEEESRKQIEVLFGQQVSQDVLMALTNEDDIRERKEHDASIMFVDIQQFTDFAEKKSPQEVLDYQNKVFDPLIRIVDSNGGIINQILGDGFMATFGAPVEDKDHSLHAFKAGQQIIEEFKQIAAEDSSFPAKLRIGLHSGLIFSGNIGNDVRKQFSVAGRTVIIAARLEQLNKQYDSQFLVSEHVHEKISNNLESIGKVPLKGVSEPMEVFKAN